MRRRVLTACVVAGLLMAAVSPVAAVEPIPGRPLPDEPPVIPLSARAATAMAFDLDDDGAREIVAVTADPTRPGMAAVQAYWVDGDGAAVASNHVQLRRSATYDDRVAIGNGIRIDDEGMTGARITEPARLFTARRDGRTVALVSAIGMNPELTSPCCLTIWEVRASGPGEIRLELAAQTHRLGYQLVAADLDGDRTDELVVTEPPDPSLRPELVIGLLRWDGAQYAVTRGTIAGLGAGACCTNISDAGQSDGIAGEDVLLVDDSADNGAGLLRLTLRNGDLRVEKTAGVTAANARIVPVEGTPAIVTSRGFEALQLWSWPRDRAPEALSSRIHRSGALLDVFAAGDDEALLVLGQPVDPSSVMIMPANLSGPTRTLGADSRAGVFLTVAGASGSPSLAPFHGPIRGGLPDNPDAFVFSGLRITPHGSQAEAVRVEPMALLPGRQLIGTAGPRDDWLGLLRAPSPVIGSVTVNERIVELGALSLPAPLELAATEAVLEPESGDGILAPTLRGVALDPTRPPDLIVGNEAIDAEISGPPGSLVRWVSGPGSASETTINANGTARIRLLQEADPTVSDGASMTPSIWIVTPTGHAYQGTWRIRAFRQPPDLGMDDEVPLVDFAPTVSGRTLPGSTIVVNGVEGEVDDDGSFAVPVEVGLAPTEIRIVVTDLVGNRTERLITRVWPLEYRDLPYGVFALLALALLAGLLYVREADAKPGARRTPDDEATFEEIGG